MQCTGTTAALPPVIGKRWILHEKCYIERHPFWCGTDILSSSILLQGVDQEILSDQIRSAYNYVCALNQTLVGLRVNTKRAGGKCDAGDDQPPGMENTNTPVFVLCSYKADTADVQTRL